MDIKNVVTIGALVVAGLALILGRNAAPQIVQAPGQAGGGITLGNGPVFNFAGGNANGDYNGGGGYPPFNSCGCGRASNGLTVVANISPVYGEAISFPEGIKKPLPIIEGTAVELVGNGVFV